MSRGFIRGQRAASPAALSGKRDNIIRRLPVKAGKSVQAGDVVDVVDGAVGTSFAALPNEKTLVYSERGYKITGSAVVSLDSAHAVAAYSSPDLGGGVSLLDLSEGTIKEADSRQFTPDAAGHEIDSGTVCIDKLNDSKCVIGFVLSSSHTLNTVIAAFDGSSIVKGNMVAITAGGAVYSKVISLSETAFLAVYSGSGLKAKICTVNGTANTAGAEYAMPGVTGGIHHVSACRLPDNGSSKRVCVCYSDVSDGNKGKAVIATISSSNTVTWGTPVVFYGESDKVNMVHDCCESNGDAIVTFNTRQTAPIHRPQTMCLLKISGSVITPTAAVKSQFSSNTRASITEVGGKYVVSIATIDPSNGCSFVVERIADRLGIKGSFIYNAKGTDYQSSALVDGSKLLLCYTDSGNSNYGTATLLEVMGDQIAGGFEVASREAIALQSGSGGESIDVIYDGVAELPGITAGTSIDSPGVRGYAPLDGVLWVRPEWGGDAVTGRYIGELTGTPYTPHEITMGWRPKVVLLWGAYMNDPVNGNMFAVVSDVSHYSVYTGGSQIWNDAVELTEDGFRLNNNLFNFKGAVYTYLAFRR